MVLCKITRPNATLNQDLDLLLRLNMYRFSIECRDLKTAFSYLVNESIGGYVGH